MTPKALQYHMLYADIASRVAQMSHARRKKVGCVIVKDGNIISMGWNGMPAGMDNNCELEVFASEELQKQIGDMNMFKNEYPYRQQVDKNSNEWRYFKLITRPEVSHAEENAIAKIAKSNMSSEGATLYVTMEPCMHCAKLIYSAGIKQVVFQETYKTSEGVEYLRAQDIKVLQLK